MAKAIGCYSKFRVKDDCDLEEVLAAGRKAFAESLTHEGNVYFEMSQSLEDERVIVINDSWANADAFNGHMAQPGNQAWMEILGSKTEPVMTPLMYEYEQQLEEFLPGVF